MEKEIKAGQVYRHYKGNLYQVIAIATHTETEEKYVVYQGLTQEIWVRPLDMFQDVLPGGTQRFKLQNNFWGLGEK